MTVSLTRFPDELAAKILFEFVGPHHIARIGRVSKGYAETVSRLVLERLKDHPMVRQIFDLAHFKRNIVMNASNTMLLKNLGKAMAGLVALNKLPPNTPKPSGFDPRLYLFTADRMGMKDVFYLACMSDDADLAERISNHLQLYPDPDKKMFRRGMEIAIHGAQLAVVKRLIKLCPANYFTDSVDNALFHALNQRRQDPRKTRRLLEYLLSLNMPMNVNKSLVRSARLGYVDCTELILNSRKPFNRDFRADAGSTQQSSDAHGLHVALLFAAQKDELDVVKAILKCANPSRKILVHVRDRLKMIKDSIQNETPLPPDINSHPDFMKIRDAENRDQILRLLERTIQERLPEQEAVNGGEEPVLALPPAAIAAQNDQPAVELPPVPIPVILHEPVAEPVAVEPIELPQQEISRSDRLLYIAAVVLGISAVLFTHFDTGSRRY